MSRVPDHRGHVVVDEEAVEAGAAQPAQHRGRVVVPLAQEALAEARDRALHVAEVHVADASARAEEVDDLVDRGLAAHLRHRAQAQVRSPGRAAPGCAVRLGQGLRRVEDVGRAAERHVDRRVVRVQGQPDAGLLGDRQHGVEEVPVVGPHLRGADRPGQRVARGELVARERVPRGGVGQVKGGHAGPAPPGHGHVGAPHERRQEVVAEQADPGLAHVADGPLVVLDLLVPAALTALDPAEMRRGHVLQPVQGQPGRLAPLPQRPQLRRGPVPARPGRSAGRVQLDRRAARAGART